LIGKYDATGRILVLPLNGHGDMNITLGNNLNTFSSALCLCQVLKARLTSQCGSYLD
jgi:hypothetical protein